MPGAHPALGRVEHDFSVIPLAGRGERPAVFVCKCCVGIRLGICVDSPAVRGYNLPRCGRSVDGSGMRCRMDAADATDRQENSHESSNIDLVQDRGAAPRCRHDADERRRLRLIAKSSSTCRQFHVDCNVPFRKNLRDADLGSVARFNQHVDFGSAYSIACGGNGQCGVSLRPNAKRSSPAAASNLKHQNNASSIGGRRACVFIFSKSHGLGWLMSAIFWHRLLNLLKSACVGSRCGESGHRPTTIISITAFESRTANGVTSPLRQDIYSPATRRPT